MLTQARLKELLDYDPATGFFVRRAKPARGMRPSGTVAGGSAGNPYSRISVDGVRYYAHRLAWLYMYGEWPEDHTDHRDGEGSNNKGDNLRKATRSQNFANARISKRNTSGFKGVSRRRDTGRFAAYVMVDRKRHCVGCFATAEEASKARLDVAQRLSGEFARS